MYLLFVDSTKWVEYQPHLEGVTAIQNIPDNLKMWADKQQHWEGHTLRNKLMSSLSSVSSGKFKMQMLKLKI